MKKKISMFLALVMIATSMFGCSSGNLATASSAASSEAPKTDTVSGETPASNAPTGDQVINFYSTSTTAKKFKEWQAAAEAAAGVKFNIMIAPTNSDTRQQKITTMLSSSDSSIDLIEINDEMATAFKNTGWLQPLQNDVMVPDVLEQFPQDYIKDMVTSKDGDIITVPYYSGILAFWVNQKKLEEAGMTEIKTKDDFIKFAKAIAKDGNYGYGGSWEKTYVFNEIATFVNLFGGDYYDWTNPGNKEALQFMYDMANTWNVTPKSQLADKYEQMDQRFVDGKHGMQFMWGTGGFYKDAKKYGEDQLHIAQMPEFVTRSAFVDSWGYALNAASPNKQACYKFLQYAASKQGVEDGWKYFDRYPARADVQNDPNFTSEVKDIYNVYRDTTILRGRPMLPQTMEFITDMGTIFQSYIQDQITLDEFCAKADEYVKAYA